MRLQTIIMHEPHDSLVISLQFCNQFASVFQTPKQLVSFTKILIYQNHLKIVNNYETDYY